MSEKIGPPRVVATGVADSAQHIESLARDPLDAVNENYRVARIAEGVGMRVAATDLQPFRDGRLHPLRPQHGLIARASVEAPANARYDDFLSHSSSLRPFSITSWMPR